MLPSDYRDRNRSAACAAVLFFQQSEQNTAVLQTHLLQLLSDILWDIFLHGLLWASWWVWVKQERHRIFSVYSKISKIKPFPWVPGDIHPGRNEPAVPPGEAEAQQGLIQQQEMPLRKDYFIALPHIRSQLEWWCKSHTIHKRQQPNEVPIHTTGKTGRQGDISLFFHSFASWWRASTVEQNMEKTTIKISQTKIAPLI